MMKLRMIMLAGLLVASVGCDAKPDKSVKEAPETDTKAKAEADPGTAGAEAADDDKEKAADEIALTSSAFADGEAIPTKYTCDGDDVSVPLSWSNLPEGTRSVAIVMHDPDAPNGTVYHWGIWAIPAGITQLPEGVATDAQVEIANPAEADAKVTAHQATNVFDKTGYGGPCPPAGDDAHHYIFEIFALDHPGTSFAEPPTAQALLSELQADANARGTLTGTYKRQQ